MKLNDFVRIDDFRFIDKKHQLAKLQELGKEAADHLKAWGAFAAQSFKSVTILTHVPPFAEACFFEGKPSFDGLPFFCCKAAGDALYELAIKFPETRFLILSGHTHDYAEVQILDNLKICVQGADYFHPKFKILEI